MGVTQAVIIHLELKHPVDIRQLEPHAVFAACERDGGDVERRSCRKQAAKTAPSGENPPKNGGGTHKKWPRAGGPTVPLQEGAHKGVDADELQLNVIAVERDPLAVRKLFDDNAVLLERTHDASS